MRFQIIEIGADPMDSLAKAVAQSMGKILVLTCHGKEGAHGPVDFPSLNAPTLGEGFLHKVHRKVSGIPHRGKRPLIGFRGTPADMGYPGNIRENLAGYVRVAIHEEPVTLVDRGARPDAGVTREAAVPVYGDAGNTDLYALAPRSFIEIIDYVSFGYLSQILSYILERPLKSIEVYDGCLLMGRDIIRVPSRENMLMKLLGGFYAEPGRLKKMQRSGIYR